MVFSHTSGMVEVTQSEKTECFITDLRHANYRPKGVSLETCVKQLAGLRVDYLPVRAKHKQKVV
jgi:hypothetical protein